MVNICLFGDFSEKIKIELSVVVENGVVFVFGDLIFYFIKFVK